MKEILAIIASVFAIVGNISYLKNFFQNKIKPHPYTWFVWSLVSGVIFFGQLQKGAGIGALPTGIAEILTLSIFFVSLKYLWNKEVGHIRVIDHYFLVIALIGIIPWIYTKDPTISVIVMVCIDLIAFVPTLRKTWVAPQTEDPILYEMNVSRHILTLFALQAYNTATTLHSVVMVCVNIFMIWLIYRKPRP